MGFNHFSPLVFQDWNYKLSLHLSKAKQLIKQFSRELWLIMEKGSCHKLMPNLKLIDTILQLTLIIT